MKALKILEPGKLEMADVPKPERRPGEALVKVASMGICGSDISAFRKKNPTMQYPVVLGHELAGVVMEVDDNAKRIRPGDRVVVEPYLYCGHCYPCSLGRTNCCVHLKVLGTQIDGGMQEYLRHPVRLLHKLPDNIPWEIAPIIETAAIALHSTRRANVRAGEYYAIFGAGPIGLLAAFLGRIVGAVPIVIDVLQDRLEKALALGLPHVVNSQSEDLIARVTQITGGSMAQAVLEASGAVPAIQESFQIASYAGRIVLTGWPKESVLMDTAIITKKELDVVGSRTANREFEDCIDYIASGELDARAIFTSACAFEDLIEMIEIIAERPSDFIKVVALMDKDAIHVTE